MTTAIETTVEFTQAQIAHRKACAFLKGILCGHAEQSGHPYHTTKKRTPEFDKGFEIGCEERLGADAVTAIHIIHNRLRHNRPHINAERDANESGWIVERLAKKHLGEGTGLFALAMEQAEKEKAERKVLNG
jgi:hypothetical protein